MRGFYRFGDGIHLLTAEVAHDHRAVADLRLVAQHALGHVPVTDSPLHTGVFLAGAHGKIVGVVHLIVKMGVLMDDDNVFPGLKDFLAFLLVAHLLRSRKNPLPGLRCDLQCSVVSERPRYSCNRNSGCRCHVL